jgi:hypothetical protein
MSMASSSASFIALNACDPKCLVELLVGSLSTTLKLNSTESIKMAVEICQESLQILHNQNKTQILSNKVTLVNLSSDSIFAICDYLDSSSKCRLRFSSMLMHTTMISCPLDLVDRSYHINYGNTTLSSSQSLLLANALMPLKVVKCGDLLYKGAGGDICKDLVTLPASRLLQFGVGRSWSVCGVKIEPDDPRIRIDKFITLVSTYRIQSIRTLVWSSLTKSDSAQGLENLMRVQQLHQSIETLAIQCSELLDSNSNAPNQLVVSALSHFKHLKELSMDGGGFHGQLSSLSGLSLLKRLRLVDCGVVGDIQWLSSLSHLEVCVITPLPELKRQLIGDIAAFSSLTKLIQLGIHSEAIRGNVEALSTLHKLTSLVLIHTQVEGHVNNCLSQMSELKELILADNRQLGGELTIFPRSLVLLSLAYCNLTIDLKSLVSLKCLKHIKLFGLQNAVGDISLLKELTSLVSIDVRRCHQITGNIDALGASLSQLTRVNFEDMPNISGKQSLFNHFAEHSIIKCPGVEMDLSDDAADDV